MSHPTYNEFCKIFVRVPETELFLGKVSEFKCNFTNHHRWKCVLVFWCSRFYLRKQHLFFSCVVLKKIRTAFCGEDTLCYLDPQGVDHPLCSTQSPCKSVQYCLQICEGSELCEILGNIDGSAGNYSTIFFVISTRV